MTKKPAIKARNTMSFMATTSGVEAGLGNQDGRDLY